MDKETSEIVLFFGRFHPIILHLPIGFLIMAFMLEVLSRIKRFNAYKPVVTFALFVGAVTSVIAAALGYMLAQGGGYNDDLLLVHQWSGIGASSISMVALVLKWQSKTNRSVLLEKAYMGVMVLMMIFLSVAGHYGGSLTHGSGYLTQYMPDGLRTIAGLPPKKQAVKITDLNEALVFNDIIYPIFDSRCLSCHNESKSKGDLMMHTPEAILAGGEDGPALMAGNSAESNLIQRIHLPVIDEDHMPPKGKSQLTDNQVRLITWWIDEGAPFDKKVAELEIDEETQAVLNTLLDPDANKSEVEILLASEVTPADNEKLMELNQSGIKLMPLSANIHWLQAKILLKNSTDSLIKGIGGVAEQLTWLDLGNTSISDNGIAFIAPLKNLTRLHLQNTGVTDEGLVHLKDLHYLEYLNLHGTSVSDDGIQHLSNLKNLRQLYLWQTNVTGEGIAQLKESLPGVEISMGVSSEPEDSVAHLGNNKNAIAVEKKNGKKGKKII